VLTPESESADASPSSAGPRWRGRLQAILLILFCLEVGIVLVLLPWSSFWDRNYFFSLAPRWSYLLSSSYVRGAVSGLGLLNVWIAVAEFWRLRL
jgi:hypothetical protein